MGNVRLKYLKEIAENYDDRVGIDGKPLRWQVVEISSSATNIASAWEVDVDRTFLKILANLLYHDNVEALADDEELHIFYNDLLILQSGNFFEIARNEYTRIVKTAELLYQINWYMSELHEHPEYVTIVNDLLKQYVDLIKFQFDQ